jgi:c(7)-type cytochrome triheme protein
LDQGPGREEVTMGQQSEPSTSANGSPRRARRLRRIFRGALLAAASCAVLYGWGDFGLNAQAARRGDVTGEDVPFAPPRLPKPKRDVIRSKDGRFWRRLVNDGLHDKANPSVGALREPARFLSKLPGKAGEIGNNVDWVAALRRGDIAPKDRLRPGADPERLDLDIIMPRTAAMPMVRFPHRAHTEWLDCSNCHDKPFIKKAGANRFNMADILSGEYCGRCHGAVAFPPTDCLRCHSVEHHEGVAN